MGESRAAELQVRFDRRIRMQFNGAKVTSDARLFAQAIDHMGNPGQDVPRSVRHERL